jgi:energy-coupling factor transport system permease protein
LIVPLFLASLRRAERMALAMDARAYGSAPVRPSMVEFHFGLKDGLVLSLAVLLALGVIFM